MPNVSSPAKRISDLHLNYAYLLSIKTMMIEIQRLGYIAVPDSVLTNLDTDILAIKAMIPLMD